MITEQELLEAIRQYESADNPNAQTCITLAAFYTVLDHLYPEEPEPDGYSNRERPDTYIDDYSSDSEFGLAIRGKTTGTVMKVMEELMQALSVIHPPLYENVIQKLRETE